MTGSNALCFTIVATHYQFGYDTVALYATDHTGRKSSERCATSSGGGITSLALFHGVFFAFSDIVNAPEWCQTVLQLKELQEGEAKHDRPTWIVFPNCVQDVATIKNMTGILSAESCSSCNAQLALRAAHLLVLPCPRKRKHSSLKALRNSFFLLLILPVAA